MIRFGASVCVVALVLAGCSPKKPAEGEAASASVAAPAAAASDVLSCDKPVKAGDTAKSLLAQYGKDAEIVSIPGPEGSESKGVVLYGKDPKHKVEVVFFDEAMTQVSSAIIRSPESVWQGSSGIHIGSSIADIERANGKGFQVGGFDWDYGGYVSDLKGGTLSAPPGGCVFGMRMGFTEAQRMANPLPESLLGERVLESNDPVLVKAAPGVEEFSVGWAMPGAN